jgi:succinoglycan biosynthesis transport protein ExoP
MSTDHEGVPVGSVSVRDQLSVVARRWRVIVVVLIVAAVASVGYVHTKAISYRSTAQVQVKPVTTSQFAASASSLTSAVSMPTEQSIASSATVADLAAKRLGNGITGAQARSHLTVSVPASTLIIEFAYTASTPRAAQAGAAAFEQAYLANRRATNQAAVASAQSGLQAQRSRLVKRENQIETQLANTDDVARRAALQGEIGSLNQRLNPISSALALLSQVDPAASTVAQSASLPTRPAGKSHEVLILGGLLVGLVIGLTAAFVIEATDDRIHGPQDLATLIGAPVLARIPEIRSARSWRRHDALETGTAHPKAAEAYRLLANRLVVAASKESLASILVASPVQGEGRSSVAANVSAAFVDLGCRVWLVSADLLPPQVHRLFSPEEASAVVTVAAIDAAPAARPTTRSGGAVVPIGSSGTPATHGHLTLTTSGGRRLREGRLLNPIALANEVRQNQHTVDITIIDAPALLEFADAVPLLPVVDGVIIVADANTTKRSELIELSEMLDDTGANVLGGVMNRDTSWVVSRRARRARRRVDNHQRRNRSRPGTPTEDAPPQAASVPTTSTFSPVDHEPVDYEHVDYDEPEVDTGGSANGWPAGGAAAGSDGRHERAASAPDHGHRTHARGWADASGSPVAASSAGGQGWPEDR